MPIGVTVFPTCVLLEVGDCSFWGTMPHPADSRRKIISPVMNRLIFSLKYSDDCRLRCEFSTIIMTIAPNRKLFPDYSRIPVNNYKIYTLTNSKREKLSTIEKFTLWRWCYFKTILPHHVYSIESQGLNFILNLFL